MPVRHATAAIVLTLVSAGCSMITTLQSSLQNSTEAINRSSAVISSNTDVVREPMERVATLEAPMSRLASAALVFDRPVLLAGLLAFALMLWGVTTFVAVRLAIVSANRTLIRPTNG